MINENNFKDVLRVLNFKENSNIFSKQFIQTDAYLKVDFDKKELIYPEDKDFVINERQTCNFSDNQNISNLNPNGK